MNIIKTNFLTGSVLLFLLSSVMMSCSPKSEPANENTKPNIIIIYADDLGYGDVGAYGSTELKTPNIDRLAFEGKRLENYYVTAMCTPTRGTFLSGRYPSYTGLGPRVIRPQDPYSLPADETTVAEVLSSVGCSTHLLGSGT